MMGMEESIYNIIPPKQVQQERPPMHKSKHSGTLPATASTFHNKSTTHPSVSNMGGGAEQAVVSNQTHRGLGKPVGANKNDPGNYMKGQAKTGKVQTLAEVKRTNPDQLKPSVLTKSCQPAVPRANAEPPVHNLVTSKNFIVTNAVETILACPKKTSTSAKDYLNKEDYGKVPKYLSQIKKDINDEYEYIRQLQQQEDEMNGARHKQMDEKDRVALLNGLKQKWEAVNTEYQQTTHLVKLDTVGKISRKEKAEAELQQIERDIERLNRKNITIDCAF